MSNSKSKSTKIVNELKGKLDKVCTINYEKESSKINEMFDKIMGKIFSYDSDDLENINIDDMIIILQKLSKKYKIGISYIFFNINSNEGMTGTLIDRNASVYNLVCTIYAKTLEELFKKAIICIYFYIKEQKSKEGNKS